MLARRGIPRIQPNTPQIPSAAAAPPKSDARSRYVPGRGRTVQFVVGGVR
jgi:hypothetical protein